MIHIFSQDSSNRLVYTLDFIFNAVLKSGFKLHTDLNIFKSLTEPKVAYGIEEELPDTFKIPSVGLLFEQGIRRQQIDVSNSHSVPGLFKTIQQDIDFDLFSAVFYLVSRYEEHLDFDPDEYGRFPSSASVMFELGILERPVADEYCMLLKEKLERRFLIKFHLQQFKFIPTYDIDTAFAFKGRSAYRTLGGAGRDFLRMKPSSLIKRMKVLRGKRKDPFDTFDAIEAINQRNQLNPVYFFLLGDYGEHDKNIPFDNTELQNIIKQVAGRHKVGIHPSFASNDDFGIVKEEINRLETITNRSIEYSRQHFLRFKFPETYDVLESLGIKKDFSMGFADSIGFRAGTSYAFKYFNITRDNVSKIEVLPFQVMDTTLNMYLGLTAEDAEQKTVKIINHIKKVKGTFVSLWHNNSFSEFEEWRGWKYLFERIVMETKE